MAHAPKVVVCSVDPVNLAGLRAVLDAAGVGPTVGAPRSPTSPVSRSGNVWTSC